MLFSVEAFLRQARQPPPSADESPLVLTGPVDDIIDALLRDIASGAAASAVIAFDGVVVPDAPLMQLADRLVDVVSAAVGCGVRTLALRFRQCGLSSAALKSLGAVI